jgi:fucose 4-O-acetylase-like acetyltransferase
MFAVVFLLIAKGIFIILLYKCQSFKRVRIYSLLVKRVFIGLLKTLNFTICYAIPTPNKKPGRIQKRL